MSRRKNVSIRLVTLELKTEPATSKQTGYIMGLIKQKKVKIKYSDDDKNLLSKKQASKFIDALLNSNPIKIVNLDELKRKREYVRNGIERSKNIKLQAKIAERKKIEEIKNMPVRKIEWLPPKPKEDTSVRRITFEEQQERLNNI